MSVVHVYSCNLSGSYAFKIKFLNIIGVSLSKPHTNHYYEKIDIVMYVSLCVCDTSSTCCTRALVYIHVRVVNLSPHARPH